MPRGKYERTPEWKKKLSNSKIGRPSGKPMNPEKEKERIEKILETKRKNGTMTTRIKDPIKRQEKNNKISLANKNRKRTQEQKDKMGIHLKNKTYEEIYGEDRAKEMRLKVGPPKGKKHSQKTINIMSEKRKQYYLNLTDEERFDKLKNWIEAGMKSSGETLKDTKIEIKVENILIEKGFLINDDYFKQYLIGRCYVDFCFPEKKIVIEVQGCYSHQCEKCGYDKGAYGQIAIQRRERDNKRKKYLESQGYKVIEIWEHQLKDE